MVTKGVRPRAYNSDPQRPAPASGDERAPHPRARKAEKEGTHVGIGLLEQSLGISGAASPDEIKARYRTLAQRCADGDARPEEYERLRFVSLALAQELAYLGHDEGSIERTLAGEGCPESVAADAARASAGRVSRLVPDPLTRNTQRPEDAAYIRLAERTLAAQSMRTATASSYGFGFLAKLAIAFAVVVGSLVYALDFFPRLMQPAKVAPQPAPPMPVQLVPPGKNDSR